MLRLLFLVGCVGLTLTGKSPNADLVGELIRRHPQVKYSSDLLEDAKLDVPDLITKYGYPVESHNVTTEDGYGLTMHRIPYGRDRNNATDPNKHIVFLFHGLLSSSSDYVLIGPNNALSYILAEEGYDVWLGNARGNFYSRRHIHLNPDSKLNNHFWKFSWDEFGYYDLPACLDYIEHVTGQSKLHFIGHSQGGTAFLVMTSLKPEYNDRIISFQGMAPASFFANYKSPIFKPITYFENVLDPFAFALGLGEFLGKDWCSSRSTYKVLCNYLMDEDDFRNQSVVPLFFGHTPAGASIRQFAHYAQSIKFNTFRRYNYNAVTNLAIYGRMTPPAYNLTLITAPTYLYYSMNDHLVNMEDVTTLASRLSNVKGLYLVDLPTFGHLDFIWSMKAKEDVYPRLLSAMREAEEEFYDGQLFS